MGLQKVLEIANGSENTLLLVNAADLKGALMMLWSEHTEAMDKAVKASEKRRTEYPTLTRRDVMKILHVAGSTLWRWEQSGFLIPAKLGRKVLYRKTDIDRVLKKMKKSDEGRP